MLSPVSRGLTLGLALYYLVLGLILFLSPYKMAGFFAWNVSPFVAMTIGGWCLGNSWMALVTGWRWRWRQVYAGLVYLWTFGLLQAAVALFFFEKLRLAHPIAWIYLATLAFSLLAALVGVIDLLRLRPARQPLGQPINLATRIVIVAFVLFVGFLGLYGLVARMGWPATNGGVFPEVLSAFTLRSFGAFYLSLAIGAAALLPERYMIPPLNHAYSAFGLILMISLAAFWFIEQFDFALHPGGMAYIGVYLFAGITSLIFFLKFGTGSYTQEGNQPG